MCWLTWVQSCNDTKKKKHNQNSNRICAVRVDRSGSVCSFSLSAGRGKGANFSLHKAPIGTKRVQEPGGVCLDTGRPDVFSGSAIAGVPVTLKTAWEATCSGFWR